MVAQGADPIPTVNGNNTTYYSINILIDKHNISFRIEGIEIYNFPIEEMISGYIGLRQMRPLMARYKNLEVTYA